MSLIEWCDDKFSVSHPEMDEQHKHWILIINTLHDALLGKGTDISSEEVIQQMIDYTKYHFAEEELLMQAARYPQYEQHKNMHDFFVTKVERLMAKAKAGNTILRSQAMSFLVGWFEDHILDHDMSYAEYVKV